MGNAAFASYSVFSTIPGLSVARKTLIFQCFQKYRYLTSAFERPDFKRMLQDVVNGKINGIIVKDLSRLGRNHREVGKYIEEVFPVYDIRIISVNDNVDSYLDPDSISSLIVPVKNLMNENYSRAVSYTHLDVYKRQGQFLPFARPYSMGFSRVKVG